MPHQIELEGIELLKNKLREQRREVLSSDTPTFDLFVDGRHAEVKTKNKPYDDLDYIGFTDNQYEKIRNEKFIVFLVCNVRDPKNVEIYEFESNLLQSFKPQEYTLYSYNKSVFDEIKNKNKISQL